MRLPQNSGLSFWGVVWRELLFQFHHKPLTIAAPKTKQSLRPNSLKPRPLLKPPLKWAGGKRWLLPRLQLMWQPYRDRRLVEPFVGGMAVALGLQPERALLNDINEHSINFYQWLKKGLRIGLPLENDQSLYYQYRERFNELIALGHADTKEAAQLFYFLNRTGFNGLCRFNRKNQFNVPFGRYKTINYTLDFRPYKQALKGWRLRQGDFQAIPARSGDFIYADPPYDVEFTNYSAGGFDWDAQVRLARWLAKHKGPVVASNQATDRICQLYKGLGFAIELLEAPRRISCTGDRTPAMEMLASKNLSLNPKTPP